MYTKICRRNCTYYRCDLWMVSRIWSCSVAPTPMLSRASRVPQSGQISVVPSVLDKAGGAAYLSPHRGHIRIRSISLFMSCHLHRFYLCFGKVVLIKSEADIPLKACAYIRKGRYSYLPFFMHDIHKTLPSPYLPRAYSFDVQFHFLFVIKCRESFVAVKRCLIRFRDFPCCNGNLSALLGFYGKIGTCKASFEKQFIIFNDCSSDHPRMRASHPHLSDVQVAAVSNVISFLHNVSILSEGNTLLPP